MDRKTILRGFILISLFVLFSSSLVNAQVLVISPHPDDDVITSAGVISRAVERGESVKVVYMTNGDSEGIQVGYVRQGEAVTAQGYLGVPENDLIFLGYPDYYLNTIFSSYINQGDVLATWSGQSTTYANRGLGLTDYHTYRFGSPASYNRYYILEDLKDILSTYLPEHIYVTSEFDTCLDHSATYQLLKLAVSSVHAQNPGYTPVIHKAIVHWDVGSWPSSINPTTYFLEIPDLSQTGLVWTDRESLDVPLAMQSTIYPSNPKYQAISAHASQSGQAELLKSFIHKDEIFWAENLFGSNRPPVANAGLDQTVNQGQTAYLDGSQSRDPDGAPLTFHWVQRSGTTVQLSNSSTAAPSFMVPAGSPDNQVLTFELVVSDNQFSSATDAVSVNVPAPPASNNIAPSATVTASSQESVDQAGLKAVDGVVDGYPGDSTHEWATLHQGVGAWLRLDWAVPYIVDKITLYDRPNSSDQIMAATIAFSDGSSVVVGPLNNDGSATTYTFPARVINTLTMTVTSVSSETLNVGLAEIQVFGTPSGTNQYTLTTGASPSGAGSVTVSPSQATYYQGQQVQLTAVPNAGYTFGSWSGDATGSTNPVNLVMNGNRSVTANFVALPGSLGVSPAGALSSTGVPGGPFSPSSAVYTLQNTGNSPIDWSASATQGWVDLSSAGGSLAPGASTTVTVSINNTAASLGLGSYSDTVTFSNLTNGNGNSTRAVNLTIVQASSNIAPLATVTASSENPADGQTAQKAVDGFIDGYPGNYTREWATLHQGAGAWLRLNWAAPYIVDKITLYDRPNSSDQIMSATITFSDGSTVVAGPLNNNGSATTYTFTARVITGLTMTVTAVSSSTINIGLSEIQVFGTPSGQTQYNLTTGVSPSGGGSITVNPSQSSYYQGQQVQLTATPAAGYTFGSWSGDATGSANPLTITMSGDRSVTANFVALPGSLSVSPSGGLSASGAPGGPFNPSSAAYTLRNTGNSAIDWSGSATQNWVGLSSTGGNLAPSASTTVTVSINSNAASLAVGSYSDTVTFSNLTNGNGNSTRAVSLTVSQQAVNIAPLATVTASSQNPADGQTALKAVDGVVDGYPGDYTREWATAHQGVGAWIQLNWPVAYSVSRIVLYDRPNSSDRVMSATITFSDGSSIVVGPLNNNGAATTYSFTARTITSLRMSVTAVSSDTINIGLSEIQVFAN